MILFLKMTNIWKARLLFTETFCKMLRFLTGTFKVQRNTLYLTLKETATRELTANKVLLKTQPQKEADSVRDIRQVNKRRKLFRIKIQKCLEWLRLRKRALSLSWRAQTTTRWTEKASQNWWTRHYWQNQPFKVLSQLQLSLNLTTWIEIAF